MSIFPFWSEEEESIIKSNYAIIGRNATQKLLPHRSSDAVQQKARSMGIFCNARWKPWEIELMLKHFETKGAKWIADKTGRNEDSVFGKAYGLNLKRPKILVCREHNRNYKGFKEISGNFWHFIRRAAKKRQFAFEITLEYVWRIFEEQDRKCALTGLPLHFSSKNTAYDGTASLDRIDSSKGYVQGNVQWVHKHANKMKWDIPEEQFITYCRLIVSKHDSRS